jgi:Ser/Thr protein kinase RdoA (MazF antagonist)
MTKAGSFKKVVRRHAEETGQRYTEALTDLDGLGGRIHHEPAADRLLTHIRDHRGIDPIAATKVSVHKTYVFRIDRSDGDAWIARAFPPARPSAGVEGDAAILRFLQGHDYPAERVAVDDAVSDFDGSAVLVTRFIEDDGHGLPEALLHGNLLHALDHAVLGERGPVAINWKASGRGPRIADLAYLMWGTWLNEELIGAGVNAYRRHVELTDDELDRLEAVMCIRPLYLMGLDYRSHIDRHHGGEVEWFDPESIRAAAAATRAAFGR